MDIKKVIDKLELIKHLHLINMLEKYTEQFTNTTPPATTPPATTPPATTPPATTPPATTPPATTPPATTPPATTPPATTPPATTPPATTPPATTPPATTPPATTKPVDETKKTTEFENNLMDSLKWVFIGIAIFIFLLIILSVVYWFMFGSSTSNVSSTENTVREDDMNRMNGDMNGMNGDMNGMNPEINPYPIENPYQEQYLNEVPYKNISGDIDNKESSIFSSLSSPFSSKVNVEPVVEMPVEPVVSSSAEKAISINQVENPVSKPESIVPINVIEEVKK